MRHKTWFSVGSKMISSNGNVNYMPSVKDSFRDTLKKVFAEDPEYVVIDGDDDWYAPRLAHPSFVAEEAGIPVVGNFHSGISGISYSGIVIMQSHYQAFVQKFKELAGDKNNTTRSDSDRYAAFNRSAGVRLSVYFSHSKFDSLVAD